VNPNGSSIEEKLRIAIDNQRNKKFQSAEKIYKEILNTDKNHTETIFHLGTLYSQIKKFSLAKPLLLKADELNPNNININLNLGSLLFNTGEIENALKYFDKVIQIQPNFVLAHFNKGIILNTQRRYKDAINCFEKVIEIEPNNINAHNVLGIILQEIGEFKKSLSYLKKSIKISPNDLRVVNTLLNLLRSVKLSNLSESNSAELIDLFVFLFKKDSIDHNELFNNARNLIFFEENQIKIEKLLETEVPLLSDKNVQIILNKKLFHLLLQKSLVREKFLEKFLCKIRKEIFLQIQNKKENSIKEFYDFIASNAEQSFLNEYVVYQTEEEIKKVNDLKKKVENDEIINELEILILACYVPLSSSKIINDKLVNYTSENSLFNDLIKLQIKDFLKEEELKKSINSFDDISDNVSKEVKEQYEENPYPRWRYTNITPKNNFLSILNNAIKPNKINITFQNKAENILIAGCGTGQQLVSKTSYANSNIIAIDLSLSSLAFAKRKMQELKHKNIEFFQGDILNLNSLNKKFNIIECVGVLHHLKNPDDGLKILLNILEPNGYLKLGLYSEYARKHIVKLKEFVKKNNFQTNITDIRNFREFAKNNSKENSFQKINLNFDFYSTSSVRDLIFHVQEHRYTLPKIENLLKKFDLEFLGFTNSIIKKEYSKIYPEDLKNTSLENWNNFEINNQDIFREMYQFWVRKKK
tara:strand:- start:292 stop:2391 length:2100 start_codon:yes stop_codon:yes gene_type:complete